MGGLHKTENKEGKKINKRRFTYFVLGALLLLVFMSGCRIDWGEYVISGRVTSVDGREPIAGVKVRYQINTSYTRTEYPKEDGTWSFWADRGDYVTIWAEKDNYMFHEAPYRFTVNDNRRDVDFKVIGWYDNFSHSQSGWEEDTYPDGCWHDYDSQGFGIYISSYSQDDMLSVTSPVIVPSNYTVTATMEPYSGQGKLGLIFNVKDFREGSFYHIFRVVPGTGDWELVQAEKGSYKTTTERKAYGTASVLTDNLNILGVTQNWNRAILSINNEVVWEGAIDTHDEEFLLAGLHAVKDQGFTYRAWFDDFNIKANGFRTLPKVRSLDSEDKMSDKSVEITE